MLARPRAAFRPAPLPSMPRRQRLLSAKPDRPTELQRMVRGPRPGHRSARPRRDPPVGRGIRPRRRPGPTTRQRDRRKAWRVRPSRDRPAPEKPRRARAARRCRRRRTGVVTIARHLCQAKRARGLRRFADDPHCVRPWRDDDHLRVIGLRRPVRMAQADEQLGSACIVTTDGEPEARGHPYVDRRAGDLSAEPAHPQHVIHVSRRPDDRAGRSDRPHALQRELVRADDGPVQCERLAPAGLVGLGSEGPDLRWRTEPQAPARGEHRGAQGDASQRDLGRSASRPRTLRACRRFPPRR